MEEINKLITILCNRKTTICKQRKGEARFMCKLAMAVENGTIVEIGRRKGGSAILLSAASPSSKIHSVDIRSTFNEFTLKTFKKLGVSNRNCTILDGESKDFAKSWTEPIDLLFVDGDHTYEGCKTDLFKWSPFIKKGGQILLHDCTKRTIKRATAKFMRSHPDFARLKRVETMLLLGRKP